MQKKVKLCREDKIYYAVSGVIVTLLLISVMYPLIHIVASSFSSGTAIQHGKVFLWPVEFSLEGYNAVLTNKDVWTGYANTIFYTVVGTLYNICMTLICAYPLSRRDLKGRGFITFFFSFTMMFGGGLVPGYLLVRDLGMLNTRLAIIVPGAMSVYNMLVVRNFIQSSIPGELMEAAQMDGCSDTKYFFKVVLPLSKASIAVITLFYAVGQWNSYFGALIYLNDANKMPLQMVLRNILLQTTANVTVESDPELYQIMVNRAQQLKYALIIVATVPIMCVYPFVQKHFVKGMMVGAIKG